MLYRRRTFATSSQDGAPVYVRCARVGRTPFVVFKEDPNSPFKGALRTHFERFATLYHVELQMRVGRGRLGGGIRFVLEKPLWTNGTATFSAEWTEVQMEFTRLGYRNARFVPLAPEFVAALSGQSNSSCAVH